nr:hypothetical protein SYMBAF_100248 [Serratia symbiotica]
MYLRAYPSRRTLLQPGCNNRSVQGVREEGEHWGMAPVLNPINLAYTGDVKLHTVHPGRALDTLVIGKP